MLSSLFSRSGATTGTIDHDAFVAVAKSGSHTLVDVREPHEFSGGTIKGAINVPLSAFDPGRIPQGKPVVLFCLSGARSAMAMQAMAKAGRNEVVNYRPGVSGWKMNGLPLA